MTMNYVANLRIPTERAHGLQIFKMSEAFAHTLSLSLKRKETSFCLIYPFRFQDKTLKDSKDPFLYYHLQHRFPLRRLCSFDLQLLLEPWVSASLRQKLFMLQAASFAFFATLYCLFSRETICFTRDVYFAIFFSFFKTLFKKKLFYEEHVIPQKHPQLYLSMLHKADGIITLTHLMKKELQTAGIPPSQILVASDAASPFPPSPPYPPEFEAYRQHIKIVYTGQLMEWKGVYTLAEAMKNLPAPYVCLFLGGVPLQQEKLQEFIQTQHLENCKVLGHFPYTRIPEFLASADLLVLPNTGKETISTTYTSPLKLFEYLSAQKPIVASAIPSLQEILEHGRNAWLVHPDDPQALAEGIRHLIESPELAQKLACQAKQESTQYTWENRAQQILEFIDAHT
jgi:glycosyltransferase involved in cell wall biosynthesis